MENVQTTPDEGQTARLWRRRRRRGRRIVLGIAIGLVAVLAFLIGGYLQQNIGFQERDDAAISGAGFVEKRVDVEGYSTAYAEGPDNGDPLVLIHGQGSQWRDHAKVLPELAESHHVFAVDVHGHGGSARLPTGEYRNARVGELLAGFLEAAVGEPALLSGHSSGGLLAAWIAANRPELVTGLLLEDPPFFSSVMPGAELTTGAGLPRLAAEYLAEEPEESFPRYFVENGDYFEFFGVFEGALVDYSLRYIDNHPGEPLSIFFLPPFVNVYFQGLVDYDPEFGVAFHDGSWYDGVDTAETLAAIDCPTVLIHTTFFRDQYGSAYSDEGVLMAAMDDEHAGRAMRLLGIPEAIEVASGHLVHYERPDVYLDAVRQLREAVG